jgi:MFS family permease
MDPYHGVKGVAVNPRLEGCAHVTDANKPPFAAAPGRDPMAVAVVSLGLTQIISWGTTLYALGVLGGPIGRDTGWSATVVFGGLTAALLVSAVVSTAVGRAIDQRGARSVMSLGSILVAVGLAGIAMATTPVAYIAAWAFLGFAMRLTLYDAAFAAIVQVAPSRGRRAISYLTLFGGVASTIFWPIGFWLEQRYGWRVTLMAFAAINLALCLPLHWWGLARREPAAALSTAALAGSASKGFGPALKGRQRRHAMVLFGFVMAASAYCFGAMASHLVTVIGLAGISATAAVTLASIKGVAQTLSRLVDLLFAKNLHPVMLGRLTLAVLPLSMVVLLYAGAGFETALAFTLLFGVANGLTTIVRGAVPLALFGPKGYGEVLGILATPYLVLNAIAPMAFAWMADTWSVRVATLFVLFVAAIAYLAIEVMAWWHRRVVASGASTGNP